MNAPTLSNPPGSRLLWGLLVIALLFLPLISAQAQLEITEFMAVNNTTLNDEDGSNSDWIEIHNAGLTTVNLNGWYLTDTTNDYRKWQFPATNLAANGYLVVFASEKDRRVPGAPLHTDFRLSSFGEYLALVHPDGQTIAAEFRPTFPEQISDVSYGFVRNSAPATLLSTGATVRALVPSSAALGAAWTDLEFDDGSWLNGTSGVGYDRQTIGVNFLPLIGLNVETQMFNVNGSIYLRLPFVVGNPTDFDTLTLQLKFEDGFVAYLNGTEVARSNAPAVPAWNSIATTPRTDTAATNFMAFDISSDRGLLLTGTNILAIHALNNPTNSPDLLMLPELTGTTPTGAALARYFPVPTPGRANNAGVDQLGPIISSPQNLPAIPADSDALAITARIRPALGAVASAALRYRVMFGGEVSVAMLDDGTHGDGPAGDGVFGASIPAAASTAGQMVRWYITATDTTNRVSRLPAFASPTTSPAYFGTVVANPALTNSLPVIHWFVQDTAAADTTSGTRASVFYNGEFYDNVFNRVRGASAPSFPRKPYKFDFNPGEHFRYAPGLPRVDEINLNTTYQDKAYVRAPLTFETYEASGVPACDAFNLRVERNGAFYSIAVLVEQLDDTFLEKRGLDPNGALYKIFQGLTSSTSGVEKKTRRSENNSDLQQLVTAVALNNPARGTNIFDLLDLPEIVTYLAAGVVAQDWDRAVKNIYVYRDTDGTGLWQMFPWDKDLSFGKVGLVNDDVTGIKDATTGASGEPYISHPFYGRVGRNCCGVNNLFEAVYATPASREMFLRRLRTLMDEILQPPGTPPNQLKYEARLDVLFAQLRNDAVLDVAKWGAGYGVVQNLTTAMNAIRTNYLMPRRTHLYQTHNIAGTATNPAAVGIPASQIGSPQINLGAVEVNPSSGNQAQEFIELLNPNPASVDISGWSIDGSVQFTFKPGTVLIAGGKLYLSPDVAAFKQRTTGPRGGQGWFVVGNYQGQLSARGETLRLLNRSGALVSSITSTGAPSAAQQFLRITEIMYHPPPPAASETNSPENFEYIELKNIGTAPLSLTGVTFANGIDFDFTGSAVTSLTAGESVVVVKHLAAFRARHGAGPRVAGEYLGNLNNNGERLQLLDASNEEIHDFSYNNSWYPVTDGLGFSLVIVEEGADPDLWDRRAGWRASGRLLGSPGATNEPAPGIVPIVVNEVLSNSEFPIVDAIELHNPTPNAASIGGWFLSDDGGTPKKFRIPDGTTIPAGGFVVFTETNFNPTPSTPLNFAFSSNGDEAYVFSADLAGNLTGHAHGFRFGAASTGVSFGRHTTSVGEEHFIAQSAVTLGTTNAGPKVGPVILSELMYHPAATEVAEFLPNTGQRLLASSPDEEGLEFIELQNISASPVPLFDAQRPANTWWLRDAVEFDFPTNFTLPSGGTVLVVGFDPVTNAAAVSAFRAAYGLSASTPLLGPWIGQLDNAGERLELLKPEVPTVSGVARVLADAVAYRDTAPWPINADGDGSSLQRLPLTAYGDDPANWSASGRTPGASNVFNQPPTVVITGPVDGAEYNQPASILISADADDADGTVLRIEFFAGSTLVGVATNGPFAITWNNAPAGAHLLTAKAFDNFGGSRISTPIQVTVLALPPTVSLISPANGAVLVNAVPIPLVAAASDSDGLVGRVEFFNGIHKLGEVITPPFTLIWSNTPVGQHSLHVRATDNASLTATSSVVTLIVGMGSVSNLSLISTGAVWKYFDLGLDLGVEWRARGFADGTWSSGPAELGYGDESEGRPEATMIGFGPSATSKYITTYFRRNFTVSQAASITALNLRILRDDGAVVYLNGDEVFRTGMSDDPVTFGTLANVVVAGDDESVFHPASLPLDDLMDGVNVLAVEVHQRSADSSDLSFDLELTGVQTLMPPFIVTPPASLTAAAGSPVTLIVNAVGTGPLTYQWRRNGANLAGANASILVLPSVSAGQGGSYSVVVSNFVGSVTSVTAILSVFVEGDYGQTVLADGPVHFYRLNETSGVVVADTGTPGGNAGTLTGGITLNQPSTSGILGSAARFNGAAGTYINLGLFHPGNSLSVEAWVNLDPAANNNPSYNAIVARWDGSFELDVAPGDLVNLVVRNQANALGIVASPFALTRGQWHHLVGIYDAGTLQLYVNGAPIASAPFAGTLRNGGPSPDRVLIGATRDGSNSSFQWRGGIDEVAVYNYALSAAQIQAHYRAAQPPPPMLTVQPPNVLAWPAYYPEFQLQFTPTLGPAAQWAPEPAARSEQNGFFKVTVPLTGTNRFYRLIRPFGGTPDATGRLFDESTLAR